MKRSHKRILLIALLLLMAVLLSSCGGVDPETGEFDAGIFRVIAEPLAGLVVTFNGWLEGIGATYSWGWAIILVALVIRGLLLPLSYKQMKSMRQAQAKTKALQPELDRLKKKYGKDKQRYQQEQMKLYQQHGITQAQMAGCLPTLLQMPILFAFYYAIVGLAVSGQIAGEPWYFIPDISLPSYQDGFSWITQDFALEKLIQPEIWPYLVLPALLAITQYVMLKTGGQTPQPGGDDSSPAAGMMGQMGLLMTGMFVFFALQVPAGLSLYWVVGNLLAMGQQLYVNSQKDRWESELELKPVLATSSSAGSSNGASADVSDSSKKSSTDSQSTDAPTRKRRKRRKRR